MELRDYLRVLRRRWISIVVIAAAFAGLAALYTALQTPQYASSARLFVSTSQSSDSNQLAQGGQFSTQRVKSYSDLVSSRELAGRVIADLGLDAEAEDLAENVSSEVQLETVNLTLTVTHEDPREAQRIAQSYAEQLTDLVRELETPAGQTVAPIKATIVDAASFSDTPVSPRWPRNIGLGVVLGAVIGLGLAVLRETLDTRIKDGEDLRDITHAPTLGAIVLDQQTVKTPLITQIPPHAPRAESFRVLRTNLQFVDVDKSQKVFVVTSAVPGEGKTSTSINLALSRAQGGTKTLLIECDLRRPKGAARLGFDAQVGVTSVLVGKVKLADALQHDDETSLSFLAAGPIPPNPAELLQSQAMTDLLGAVRDQFDVVLIDAPPLLPVTDAALLSVEADGAILVVSHAKVTRDQVAHAIDRLKQVDATLVGVVLNRVPTKMRGYGYGYGYGYAPASDDAEGRAGRSRKRGRTS
jgi:capsular exopolysaccharide synthesis family protein